MRTILLCLAISIASVASIDAQIYGCTDSAAPNFDATADTDDGSCCYDHYINLSMGTWLSLPGVTWEVLNEASEVVLSGGIPADVEGCLPDGCYTVNVTDANGNEFNIFALFITDEDGVPLIDYEWPLDFDFNQSFGFCLSADCIFEDFDCNLVINTNDLFALLADYGCTNGCTCDINGDGATNTTDLLAFLSALFN